MLPLLSPIMSGEDALRSFLVFLISGLGRHNPPALMKKQLILVPPTRLYSVQ
ncbi:Uncharacterised protein [Vibrio cholerae]|nr:Uncharacterised protein [Vibrio cholerae]